MKLRLSIVLLAVIALAGCEKDEENGMDFKITGIRDTVIERGQSFQIPLKVFYLGGEKEKVTVTSSGNGTGVSIGYEPATGEPDYSLVQYISASTTADTGIYVVTVTGTSESKRQFSKSFKLHVTEVVNSKPVIILIQGDTVNHSLNSPWFDPGFTASDVEDGDLTSQVQVTGNVNINLQGNYVLTYSVTDSDGETTTRNRQVRVVNDVAYFNGNYTVSQIGTPIVIFTTTIAASNTDNNHFTIYKIGNNFQADPYLIYNNNNDSVVMPPQTFLVSGVLNKTFAGGGVRTYVNQKVTIDLYYTESYTDTITGLPVTNNRHDVHKQN